MTMHANMHPDEGADDRATNLGGADVTNCNVDGGRKHPPHTKCDTHNPLGDRLVALVGVLAILTLSTIAFIALHTWGIGDSYSVNFLSAFAGAALAQLR